MAMGFLNLAAGPIYDYHCEHQYFQYFYVLLLLQLLFWLSHTYERTCPAWHRKSQPRKLVKPRSQQQESRRSSPDPSTVFRARASDSESSSLSVWVT